jgi:RNA chaperone ProQ/FINO-like protein
MSKDVIGLLANKFPAAFSCVDRERRPLKIGIHYDILAALGDAVTPDELKHALRVYTANSFYRAQLRPGVTRIDLAGKPAGVVAEQVKPKPPPPKPPPPKPPPPSPKPPPQPLAARRMSLADLRAAARRRKQQQQAEG